MLQLAIVGEIWRYVKIIPLPSESRADSGLIRMGQHEMDGTAPYRDMQNRMDKIRHRVGIEF